MKGKKKAQKAPVLPGLKPMAMSARRGMPAIKPSMGPSSTKRGFKADPKHMGMKKGKRGY